MAVATKPYLNDMYDEDLSSYFKDVQNYEQKHPVLSRDREKFLANQIKKGDNESTKSAIDELVSSNLRFAVDVASIYRYQGMTMKDLVQEANIGLMKAAKRYDGRVKFISYAVWWARQSVLDALSKQSRIVKIPLNKISEKSKVGKFLGKLDEVYGRNPSDEEVAEYLGMSEDCVSIVRGIKDTHISLDQPLGSDEDATLLDTLCMEDSEEMERSNIAESVRKCLHLLGNKKGKANLTEKEMQAVKLYYGIDTEYDMTLEGIGNKFSLTRERARQILNKGKKKLLKVDELKKLYREAV